IAVRAVADQREPVRNRRGRDAELPAHSLLVAHLARAPIELDDPSAADALRQVLVRRAHDDLLDSLVAGGHRRRCGQRVVRLELDHRPDDHAERPQRIFQRLELRAKERIDPLPRLGAGPERIAKGLDDVVGGDPQMRSAVLEDAEDRSDDTAHRSELGRRAPVESRRRREEIAEQLVGPVDQMDDHEVDDTVESRVMKFGLRYANLGRYAAGPAAVELAQAAEAAGVDSIWTGEHVVVPDGYQSRYPYSPTGRMGAGLEDFPIPD